MTKTLEGGMVAVTRAKKLEDRVEKEIAADLRLAAGYAKAAAESLYAGDVEAFEALRQHLREAAHDAAALAHGYDELLAAQGL